MNSKKPLMDKIVFKSTIALVLSAFMLLGLFIFQVESDVPATEHVAPVLLTGEELRPVVGKAEVSGEALVFSDYGRDEGVPTGVAVWRGRLQADEFAALNYQLSAPQGSDLKLIWRSSSNPRELYHTALQNSGEVSMWLDLSRLPEWQGTILEVGVYAILAGDTQPPLSISFVHLQPRSWRSELAVIWSHWTGWNGWTAGSINYIYGSEDPSVLSPVLVAAAWSALAAVLLLLAGLIATPVRVAALAVVFLVPWLALDLLWQNKLLTQLETTSRQFAGKTSEEKHLVDNDADIYQYIQRLKHDVLPQESARIVILHNSYSHNFERLKAQYYLLPHSAYNFGKYPPRHGLDSVDYVLILGELPKVYYSDKIDALIWRKGKRVLPVERVDTDPMGNLYRIKHAEKASEKSK